MHLILLVYHRVVECWILLSGSWQQYAAIDSEPSIVCILVRGREGVYVLLIHLLMLKHHVGLRGDNVVGVVVLVDTSVVHTG